MDNISKGLKRLGVLQVVDCVLRNSDATAADLVDAITAHLEATGATREIGNTEEVCAVMECLSNEIAEDVVNLLEGKTASTAAVMLEVWDVLKNVAGYIQGKFVYVQGTGNIKKVYHALFRWAQFEDGKVALVGVMPGDPSVFSMGYETVQCGPANRPVKEVYNKAIANLVQTFLSECPLDSYTPEFLTPIAQMCSLRSNVIRVGEWCVSKLLIACGSPDCAQFLTEVCTDYVWDLIPEADRGDSMNTFARLMQHLIYHQRMIQSPHQFSKADASVRGCKPGVSSMSLG